MFSNGNCTLNFRKRDRVYRNSTETCVAYIEDKKNISARSYRHWLFLTNINGLVVFNHYSYSVSTSGHQRAVRALIRGKIKIDVEVCQRESLDRGVDLSQLYETFLMSEITLERKGLSAKTRAAAEHRLRDAQNDIERLIKAKVCKRWGRKKIKELKKVLIERENLRLSRNRDANREKLEKMKLLKPKLSDVSPLNFETIDKNFNNLNEIEIK